MLRFSFKCRAGCSGTPRFPLANPGAWFVTKRVYASSDTNPPLAPWNLRNKGQIDWHSSSRRIPNCALAASKTLFFWLRQLSALGSGRLQIQQSTSIQISQTSLVSCMRLMTFNWALLPPPQPAEGHVKANAAPSFTSPASRVSADSTRCVSPLPSTT